MRSQGQLGRVGLARRLALTILGAQTYKTTGSFMTKQRGFTLIELMIVLAIIAILLLISVPAYKNYAVRAKVEDGLNLVGSAKTAIEEFQKKEGHFSSANPSNASYGIPTAASIRANNVSSVLTNGSQIVITYADDEHIQGQQAIVQGSVGPDGAVKWKCISSISHKFLPPNCHDH